MRAFFWPFPLAHPWPPSVAVPYTRWIRPGVCPNSAWQFISSHALTHASTFHGDSTHDQHHGTAARVDAELIHIICRPMIHPFCVRPVAPFTARRPISGFLVRKIAHEGVHGLMCWIEGPDFDGIRPPPIGAVHLREQHRSTTLPLRRTIQLRKRYRCTDRRKTGRDWTIICHASSKNIDLRVTYAVRRCFTRKACSA